MLLDNAQRNHLQRIMSQKVGVLRSKSSMNSALDDLAPLMSKTTTDACTENWEMTNLHTVASAIAWSALHREETRGSHWREDFPESRNEWLRRIVITATEDGALHEKFENVPQVPDTKEVL
jgi:L-aspartate oxidase